MSYLLVVDDDVQLAQSFSKLLAQEGYEVATASSGEEGLDRISERSPDLVVMDVRMPGISGIETLTRIREIDPKLPVIIMTAFGDTDTAIEATKMGAFDYVLKPFDIPDILALIGQALDAGRLMREKVGMAESAGAVEALIGKSEVMQEVYKAVGRVAPTDATVLIRGESGTGKELVARAIYQHSGRADKPLLVINCVAIPETLLESELFGYEKGAFTGAGARKFGKIEQADGGTVFLDEIGDMPMSIQSKILRLLQERSLERLGGKDPIRVDVRIIAATNRDLEAAIREGRFREDLYYRLKVVTLEVPPLRDRKADLPVLADHFAARHARAMGMENPGITEGAKSAMVEHNWPGNVRELENVVHKAVIFSRGCPIRAEEARQAILGREEEEGPAADEIRDTLRAWIRGELMDNRSENRMNHLVDELSALIIAEALDITGGNRSRAAKLLGLARPTLQAKIEKYNLKINVSVSGE